MRNKLLYCAVLVLATWISSGAQKSENAPAQRFSVLSSGHLVTASETLSNSNANCSISGTGRDATMLCRSAGGTAKASYHFNTALVLDSTGMAYVIACRLSLVSWWCKTLPVAAVLSGNIENGHAAISDGQKAHDYQVLLSQYVGSGTPNEPAASERAQPAGVQPGSQKSAETAAEPKKAKTPAVRPDNLSSDPSVTCMSYTGACVVFSSEPLGADIYVDAKFVGNTPSTLTLTAGSHEIRIEARSMQPWIRTFEAVAGSKITIRAMLKTLPK